MSEEESTRRDRPMLAWTMGDVAGVGPEVIVKTWSDPEVHCVARPLVVGSSVILRRAVARFAPHLAVEVVESPRQAAPDAGRISCLDVNAPDVEKVTPGQIDARAGLAAHRYLIVAIDHALAQRVDGIVTLPLHKESLNLAGFQHPGHTEILAERCGTPDHAMMLFLEPSPSRPVKSLAVVHVTLHVALREVFDLLSIERIASTIRLVARTMQPFQPDRRIRVGVAGVNPHAGENGLFGDEEIRLVGPAIEQVCGEGLDVEGPIPADTLFVRALDGEFDAVVAMYHDQGHVALKTIGFDRAVNVTLGLPIVRTSVAHGTAFDIAWHGRAQTASLRAAHRVAARFACRRRAEATTL